MNKKNKDKIWHFLACKQEGSFELEHIRKAVILNLFVFIGTILVIFITINSFIKGNYLYALFMISYIIIENTTLIYFCKTLNYNRVLHFVIIPIFIVIVAIFINGSYSEGTTIFWAFMFPVFVFFLAGKRIGMIYTLILFFILIYFFIFPVPTMHNYSDIYKQKFILAWLCTTSFTYVFEVVRQNTYNSFINSRQTQNKYLAEVLQQKEEIQTQAEMLEKMNSELEQQKEEIIEHTENIKASIRYAQTIQNIILPETEEIDKLYDNFIIYLPKDIVSGDFYWLNKIYDSHKKQEQIFFAVVDCTGHGVPGAFMSMIATRILNEIINQKKLFATDIILYNLKIGIQKALKQESNQNRDGMDICLVKIIQNNDIYEIQYTGAKRPLYYFDNNKLIINELEADRISIGGVNYINPRDFTIQHLFLKKDDILYLSTDGFCDQNNETRKRFGSKRFINILNNIAIKDMNEQKNILLNELHKWNPTDIQRDDITIVALKMK